MALSNMRNEPRREITETMIGVVIVGGLIFADYSFAAWLANTYFDTDCAVKSCMPWLGVVILMMLFTPVGVGLAGAASVMLVIFTHHVGEELCDFLEARGVHLRPVRVRR